MSNNQWLKIGSNWLNLSAQRSEGWYNARKGRITASNFATAIGISIFSTAEQLADDITGIKKKVVTKQSQELMDYGTEHEDDARKWYERISGNKVEEIGLIVPEWQPLLGCSLDGCVLEANKEPWQTDGMIEIKCPKKFYQPLNHYMLNQSLGWQPEENDHNHIWPSHWCQIQGCLAITEKKWCDYVVFCQPEKKVFVERINFDSHFWLDTLLPKLTNFITNELEPRLNKQNIKVEIPDL